MLRRGHRDWAIPLLRILKVFLEQKPFLWTEDKFRLVTETVQELSSTTDKALMECAEEVTTVLMKKGKPGLLHSCTGVFNFLHNHAAIRELRSRSASKSSDTFAHYSVQEAKLADKRFSDKIQHHSLKAHQRPEATRESERLLTQNPNRSRWRCGVARGRFQLGRASWSWRCPCMCALLGPFVRPTRSHFDATPDPFPLTGTA